ncbi:MAG: adenylyltransferase/cytidyltransferase family protein [Anaerolineae bacterium]|nr:adenylyltransferase/cytidyltransferase family protein [Anaerolineae bacterium]
MTTVIVCGGFDNLRSRHVRFLEEAAKLGELHVLLWSDDVTRRLAGTAPKFPEAERQYLVEAIRYVNRVLRVTELASPDALPDIAAPATDPALKRRSDTAKGAEAPWPGPAPDNSVIWAVDEADDTPAKRAFCAARGLGYRVFATADLAGFPDEQEAGSRSQASGDSQSSPINLQPSTFNLQPSVIVTGCYDWLHSGHVRFFEEASSYGDLIVAAGNDANVRNLKGEGHPLQTQEERRYMIGAIRYVKLALVTTGWGWLDAEPEIARLRPDIYLVNEDGDKPEKREFCETHGLRYVVLKRTPKEGLPRRSSSDLRGF